MQPGSAPAGDLDLRNFFQVARRHWKVIVVLGLLIPTVSVLISLRREPRYAASAEVLVKRQNLAAGLTPGQVPYTDAQTAERVIETQVQLARVPDLADRVIAAANLTGRRTAADFLASSTVTAKTKSDILVLTVESTSPSEARNLASSYADQFTRYRRQLDVTELDALAASVRDQLGTIDTADRSRAPLYEDLQAKLRQIQTLQALQTSSAVVVRSADTVTKVGPAPATMGAGGLLLGLILGGGIAFLLESLDTRVFRSSEVAAILRMPLLARLPDPPARLRKRSALVMIEQPESPPAEAFAFLRTNLTFAHAASDAKVIMFCSAVEQEGKSTTVSNLAVAFAQSGSRVVLVDLDHRRPTVHSFFAVSRSPGVTEVSRGAVRIDDALRDVPIPFRTDGPTPDTNHGDDQFLLRVLPAGAGTHGIDLDDVSGVLDRLRDRADVVLVDAPPLLQVGEALALAARMDGLVVVTRLNHVRRPMLEELRRAFDTAPVRPLGFVVTAAAEEPGYSRYYSQAYGPVADEETRLTQDVPLPRPPGVPSPAGDPNGLRDSPPAPVPARETATETATVGSPHREALLDAVFADGPRAADGRRDPDGGPAPPVGVQPRRSWAQRDRGAPSPPSPGAVEDVPAKGDEGSRNGTGRDEGAEG